MVKDYYRLTKPGIIYGNVMTTAAGYLLACAWHIHIKLAISVLLGTALVIAAACVVNNYIDRGIDAKMDRTKGRALVGGRTTSAHALLFAIVLAAVGFSLLITGTNLLTTSLGMLAFLDYVVLYGYAKRHSEHGTLVGSISGAIPIVAGYTAVTNRLDGGALLLFLLLTFWQMPHFYGIALYRSKDYKAAGIPVLPLTRGVKVTQTQSLIYIVAFALAGLCLTIFDYAGVCTGVALLLISIIWLAKAANGLRQKLEPAVWGRQIFLFSLTVILTLSVAVALGSVAP